MSMSLSIKRTNNFGTYHIHVWHGCNGGGYYTNTVIIDKITKGWLFKKVTEIYRKEICSAGEAIEHAEKLSADFNSNPLFIE
jgi:hypothetical protein